MDRREFVSALTFSLFAAPPAAKAQSAERVYQVGILTLGPGGQRPGTWWQPLIAELRELNYVEGHSLVVRSSGADARPDRLAGLAASLARGNVRVIGTTGPLGAGAA